MPTFRGVEQSQEQAPQGLLRDTRTLGQRTVDFFKNPLYVAALLVITAVSIFVIPAVADLIFLIGLGSFVFAYTRKIALPFRMPKSSNLMDYNDPKTGSMKPQSARGICFFGNDRTTGEELWFTNEDMRTHVLIFGATGSGKTQALLSLSFNALVEGSGFIYVDGKGDNSLFSQIFSICRRMGREDDLLLINFMTGARDVIGPQEKRLSNTMNPFSHGSSSMLSQLVVSLMDSASASSDADMWKGRAIVFVEALMKLLVYMRDQGHILLDANTVRNYFTLDKIEAIVIDKVFVRDNQEPVNIANAPLLVMEPLTNYLINLPGYDRGRKGKQVSQVLEQHGFITMQLTRVFGSLADTYGHIIRTNVPEVDMRDVVLNRRVLCVLLPALEKSPDELANLGKVIVASLKAMMAAGLGDEVEGTYRDVIQRKPTMSKNSFFCILDEYGYYAVKGFAVVPAQARSLGFSTIFAGQDLPALEKASKEEAASIGANTNIKICMKLEDPQQTWEFFQKTAGEAYVTKVDAFQTKPESVMNTYSDTRSSSAERRSRIDLLDLKDQREGEAHIFFKSRIVRASMFYANPPPVKEMRLNQFLKVEPPPGRFLIDLERRLGHFVYVVQNGGLFSNPQVENEDINFVSRLFSDQPEADPIELSVNVLLAYQNHKAQQPTQEEEVAELPENEVNVFTKMRLPDSLKSLLVTSDIDRFGTPLLSRNNTREQVELIEKLSGKIDKHSGTIATEIVKDMQLATHYPPLVVDKPTGSEVADVVKLLIDSIVTERQNKANQPADKEKEK